MHASKFNIAHSKELSVIRESLVSQARESSFDTSYTSQLEGLARVAKSLSLRVLSSSGLPSDTVLTISAKGAESSERGVRDGCTYFGCGRNRPPACDIVIPDCSRSASAGQHFVVYYDLLKDSYFIRDLGVGFGTFAKVDAPLLLKNNYLLLMGSHFVLVTILDADLGWRIIAQRGDSAGMQISRNG